MPFAKSLDEELAVEPCRNEQRLFFVDLGLGAEVEAIHTMKDVSVQYFNVGQLDVIDKHQCSCVREAVLAHVLLDEVEVLL
jgi:hypothetical protein